MDDPQFKTVPYDHQLIAFNRFKDDSYFALFFEQRVGKTKVALDVAAHKFRKKVIDSLLIIAPNGVHRQWIQDAIPEHLPDDVRGRCVLWQSSKATQVGFKRDFKEMLTHDGLHVLAVNVDALTTVGFKTYANHFFKGHRVMVVLDESGDISNGKAARTKAAMKIGRVAKVRVILDGTPVAAGPLGVYSQCDFLSPGALGFTSFYAFRARYAELEMKDFGERDKLCPDCHHTNPDCERCRGRGVVGKNQVQVVKGYLNIDELQHKLNQFSSRVLRSDCCDLPPKIFQKIYFDLPPDARRVYDDLRDSYVAELKEGTVTAAMVLTRYLRLQQVSSGFLPLANEVTTCPECQGNAATNIFSCDTCEGIGVILNEVKQRLVPVSTMNVRLEAFLLAVGKLPGQGIVWCRFDRDVDSLMAAATASGVTAVRYDGRVGAEARAAAVAAFQGGAARWFVSKARAGGRGLDLAAADWVCYYSHDWSLRMRLQSEDRAQSLKKQTGTLYLDFIAADTVDDKIVTALREGKHLSDLITGDKVESWL